MLVPLFFDDSSHQGARDVRTIVVQSYRSTRVEPWIQRCMQSVREWAVSRGYIYEFIDDALFDFLPAHIRNNPTLPLLPKTDIARLDLLSARLAEGFERAIWLDADILVFNPAALTVPEACGAMFCHEIWTSLSDDGELLHAQKINNALMVFEHGHPLLNFLRYAAVELYEHHASSGMSTVALGTTLLSKLGHVIPLRLHTQVACLSPILLRAAYRGEHAEWLRAHAQRHGQRFHAANLCHSLLTKFAPLNEFPDEQQLLRWVEQLIATRGSPLFGEAVAT